jgi:sugar-specific transcriptional regulator TrmB
METKILEEIGFSQGEIKIYFALLGLGESTIGPISKKSGITASKTYPILEKLISKGLITHVIKSGTKYFQVLNPNRIVDFMNEKENRIKQEKEQVKKLLPLIAAQQKKEAKQYATVYETLKGVKTLYDEMIEYHKKTKEDFIAFTMGEEYKDENLNRFFRQYDTKRGEAGIKIKLIGLESQRKFLEKEYAHKPSYMQIRYLEHAVPSGTIIFGDNVAILLWYPVPTAFVIHSKQTAESHRKFFWDLWKIAKK